MRFTLLAPLVLAPSMANAQSATRSDAPRTTAAPAPLWRARADIAFGLAAQWARVPDGYATEVFAPTLDITLGADRRIHRFFRVAIGVAHVVPLTRSLSNSEQAPARGDTSFYWTFAVMPSAAIEFAPVAWWSAALGVRGGVGFGNANVLLSTNPFMWRDEAGAWPIVHAFAQTAFALPTRPSFGLGARAAAGWSLGPDLLLEALLTAAY